MNWKSILLIDYFNPIFDFFTYVVFSVYIYRMLCALQNLKVWCYTPHVVYGWYILFRVLSMLPCSTHLSLRARLIVLTAEFLQLLNIISSYTDLSCLLVLHCVHPFVISGWISIMLFSPSEAKKVEILFLCRITKLDLRIVVCRLFKET